MLPRIGFADIIFGQPEYLWFLVVPSLLLLVWAWRLAARRSDARRVTRGRIVPVASRFAFAGDLPFWLCLILSTVFIIVALARPHGPAIALRQGGVDLVILQDGSASMRVERCHRSPGTSLTRMDAEPSWRITRSTPP